MYSLYLYVQLYSRLYSNIIKSVVYSKLLNTLMYTFLFKTKTLLIHNEIGGRSQTTLTDFWTFLNPPPPG